MAFDLNRTEKGKLLISFFLFQALTKWGEFLMKTPTKIAVFLAACGLLAAGVYGTTKITQKFEWKKLSRDGSYFRNYAEVRDEKFPAGYDVSIILAADGTDIDYSSKKNLKIRMRCKNNKHP